MFCELCSSPLDNQGVCTDTTCYGYTSYRGGVPNRLLTTVEANTIDASINGKPVKLTFSSSPLGKAVIDKMVEKIKGEYQQTKNSKVIDGSYTVKD